MTVKILALATSCTVVLALAAPVMTQPQYPNAIAITNVKQQMQETSISLSLADLRKPYYLEVQSLTTATKITGKIKLNGKIIQSLYPNTKINLSSRLSKGKHTIEISGQYYPRDAIIEIKFWGINTQISQQVSGNGSINQRLIIEVK